MTRTFELETARDGWHVIDAQVRQAVAESGVKDGICLLHLGIQLIRYFIQDLLAAAHRKQQQRRQQQCGKPSHKVPGLFALHSSVSSSFCVGGFKISNVTFS